MIASFGWGIAIIEFVVIFVLLRALDEQKRATEACMKWTARYMIRKKMEGDR